jgi:hypothetical protein
MMKVVLKALHELRPNENVVTGNLRRNYMVKLSV